MICPSSIKAALYLCYLRVRYRVFVFMWLTYQTLGAVAIRAVSRHDRFNLAAL